MGTGITERQVVEAVMASLGCDGQEALVRIEREVSSLVRIGRAGRLRHWDFNDACRILGICVWFSPWFARAYEWMRDGASDMDDHKKRNGRNLT